MKNIPVIVVVAGGVVLTVGLAFQWRRSSCRSTVKITSSPNPNWKLGDKQLSPYKDAGMISVDPKDIPVSENYPLVISGIVPRPVAFVSSLSSEGVGNLAPFSYFCGVAHDPPCVVISVCRSGQRSGSEKDTARNILDTNEWFVESANYTCAPLVPEVNEMELVNLTPIPSTIVTSFTLTFKSWSQIKPPRVEESAFQMECRLRHHYDIENNQGVVKTTVFIGEVVMFHISNGIAGSTPSGKMKVEFEKLKPICRLGGNSYGCVTSIFDLPRPDRTV